MADKFVPLRTADVDSPLLGDVLWSDLFVHCFAEFVNCCERQPCHRILREYPGAIAACREEDFV
jgi:hypothetical protein